MNEMTIDVFEQLYREYHSRLYHYALHLTHDAEAASDVVAEVFAIAWKRRDALDAERVQGYLYAAVHNQSLNWLRRQERLAPMPDSSQHDWTDEDLEEVLAREARIKEIEKVSASMTERTRYVFIQCYYQKRSYRDVAEQLSITTDGVKKHVMKALSTLRKHFHKENAIDEVPERSDSK